MGTFYNTPGLNSVALNGSIEYIFGFTDVFNDDFYTWLTPLEKSKSCITARLKAAEPRITFCPTV